MSANIIAIVGDSGSGKTYASLYLQEHFGWNAIVSYTTRPKRKYEKNGREHWFVSDKDMPSKSNMCAYTQFGGFYYWTEWNQFQTLFNSVYVIDEKGLIDLCSKEQTPIRFNLITVKIKRPNKEGIEKDRMERDKERTNLADEFYDYVVENDGSLEQYCEKLNLLATDITNKYSNGSRNR